jgi:hypothetical protein
MDFLMRAWRIAVLLAGGLVGAGAFASPALADTGSSPSLAATAPILQETPSGTWHTTVLLTGFTGKCPAGQLRRRDYELETTAPSLVRGPSSVAQVASAEEGKAGASCEVLLTFLALKSVPATATLVLLGSSSVTLTVSRYLTPGDYLGPPAAFGGIMTAALLILALLFVRVYDRTGGRLNWWRLWGKRTGFWTYRISASGAWTLNDSWATNIVTAAGLLGSILGFTLSPADSPFHGLGLDRFAILAAIAAGIAAAAPLLFSILYGIWSGISPGMTDRASVKDPAGGETKIGVPSGAKVLLPWGATLTDQGQHKEVSPGSAVPVPPGAVITVGGAHLAFPAGSDILVQGDGVLAFRRCTAEGNFDAKRNFVAEGNFVAGYQISARDGLGGSMLTMAVRSGATVTVSGVAEVTLPPGVQIDAPGRKTMKHLSHRRREFRWPQTANSLAGTMWMMIITALVTVFGIGAELGIAWELGTRLSDASPAGHHLVAWCLGVLAGGALIYSVTAVCTMADPQPGSSMSATPGTSFTL